MPDSLRVKIRGDVHYKLVLAKDSNDENHFQKMFIVFFGLHRLFLTNVSIGFLFCNAILNHYP